MPVDYEIRDAGGRAFPYQPEVFMEWFVATDAGDNRIAVLNDWVAGDVPVPLIRGWQQQPAGEISVLSDGAERRLGRKRGRRATGTSDSQ